MAACLYQLDKDYFLRQGGPATPGYRDWRGSEMMGVSAQSSKIHLAIAFWTWPSLITGFEVTRLKLTPPLLSVPKRVMSEVMRPERKTLFMA